MKNTALSLVHEALGAKMVPFAGYNMPVQYSGVIAEHKCVREKVGVFDVSHMGEFFLKGEGVIDLIQSICTNDASKLVDGQAQYTCMPNDEGGIIDDLIIYRFSADHFMLVVNASNIEKDWNWIKLHNTYDVEMTNRSDEYSLLAIQGPLASEAMQSVTDIALSDMKFYTFQQGKFAGAEDVIVSATGYTGSGGFEIYFKNQDAEKIWKTIFEAGKEFGIEPIGLAARDTLRLEKGYCLYGNDITDETSPLEAGLGWITKFTKEFVNSKNLKKQKEDGIKRKLVGFELLEKGIPRNGYDLEDTNSNKIGFVTSGTMSPSLSKPIGMGYVSVDFSHEGSEIFVRVRNKSLRAKVVKFPFK